MNWSKLIAERISLSGIAVGEQNKVWFFFIIKKKWICKQDSWMNMRTKLHFLYSDVDCSNKTSETIPWKLQELMEFDFCDANAKVVLELL